MADLRSRLVAALGRPGHGSSDFDLNPGVGPPKGRPLRAAAVLVPVIETSTGADVLLTKRSSALSNHPGQVAFPGGKVDDADAGTVDAALREANEEIGLDPANVDVLGAFAPHITVTGFEITPVVGLIKSPFRPVAEPGEVAEVFTAPFAHVTDPGNFRIEGRQWQGMTRRYYAVPWGAYYIWGATARMLRVLADGLPR
ncbi:MAG: CoA pyrophosphatase [Pseudomonadota bacterium]